MNANANKVVSYWFPSDGSADMDKWFMKSQSYDDEICEKFGPLLKEAEDGKHFHWLLNKASFMAHIVLLDQMSRHVHRGTGDSFKNDPGVLIFTELGIDVYFDTMNNYEKMFALLPYMHSELLMYQEKGLERLERVLLKHPEDKFWKNMHMHTLGHLDTVRRFGRFPKRNVMLGRKSTEEEEAYMKEHMDRPY